MNQPEIIIAGLMLTGATYLDLKNREVPDKFWLPFIAVGIPLLLFRVIMERSILPVEAAASIGLSLLLGYLLYHLGFFGGADAKALGTLAVLVPVADKVPMGNPFFPIVVFINCLFLTLALPLYFLSSNAIQLLKGRPIFQGFEQEPWWKKAVAMLVGRRLERPGRFYFLMEETAPTGKRFKITLLRGAQEFTQGRDVWVTPGLPLLLFLALGYILALIVGDVVALLLSLAFS